MLQYFEILFLSKKFRKSIYFPPCIFNIFKIMEHCACYLVVSEYSGPISCVILIMREIYIVFYCVSRNRVFGLVNFDQTGLLVYYDYFMEIKLFFKLLAELKKHQYQNYSQSQ